MREIYAKVSKFQQSHAQKKESDKAARHFSQKVQKVQKSAKPIFALNGAGDGSLWVVEYLTNNERISN